MTEREKLRILVVAHRLKYAREAAEELFKDKPGYVRYTDTRLDTSEASVELAAFMDNLGGRQYDRIIIVQQKKLLQPYSHYLTSRLAIGGRFERYSE